MRVLADIGLNGNEGPSLTRGPRRVSRILQLCAARGWTLEKTARVFLVDLQTLLIWMRRLDEQGERDLVQTVEPVNRSPDFVRNLVRRLKVLFPMMGAERMAQILSRIGLGLAATSLFSLAGRNRDGFLWSSSRLTSSIAADHR